MNVASTKPNIDIQLKISSGRGELLLLSRQLTAQTSAHVTADVARRIAKPPRWGEAP
jgi:hypothetical protein